MKTITILLILSATLAAQTIYELTPGTKNNEITLTLSNISNNHAQYIQVKLIKSPASLKFSSNEQLLKHLDPDKESDISFIFDVERTADVNKTDTAEFQITSGNGIYLTKSFLFSYVAPKEFRLEQNFPNPFNPSTTIQYQLPLESRVNLRVYSILGKEVTVLADEVQSAGFKEIKFNGSDFASGVYIYKLTASASSQSFTSIKKMLLVK